MLAEGDNYNVMDIVRSNESLRRARLLTTAAVSSEFTDREMMARQACQNLSKYRKANGGNKTYQSGREYCASHRIRPT